MQISFDRPHPPSAPRPIAISTSINFTCRKSPLPLYKPRTLFTSCCPTLSDTHSLLRPTYRLRRDGRSNGTAILRRSSTTPFNNTQAFANTPAAIDTSLASSATAIDPPTASAGYQAVDPAAAKYTREELLEIGRATASRQHDMDIDALTIPGFNRGGHVNGNSSRGWGKTSDANAHNDPTICWNDEGSCGPLGLRGMSTEEKEVGISVLRGPDVQFFPLTPSPPYLCGIADQCVFRLPP